MSNLAENKEEEQVVIAYFDGDVPVFRSLKASSATPSHAVDDDVIEDDSRSAFTAAYSSSLPRDISYELDDDEPVYRSLGSLDIGAAPAPPSLRRQRGFGQPGLCD